jgi:hypothetical protein
VALSVPTLEVGRLCNDYDRLVIRTERLIEFQNATNMYS